MEATEKTPRDFVCVLNSSSLSLLLVTFGRPSRLSLLAMDSSDGRAPPPALVPVSPLSTPDPGVPLFNLSVLRQKMDSLHDFLAQSIESKSQLTDYETGFVSMEITSAIHNIILNGAALVASSVQPSLLPGSAGIVEKSGGFEPVENISSPLNRRKPGECSNSENQWLPETETCNLRSDMTVAVCYPVSGDASDSWVLRNFEDQKTSNGAVAILNSANKENRSEVANNRPETINLAAVEPKEEDLETYQETRDDSEIIELDALELLAEHVHFCDICGKGFKRDANLRMHMRAHGDKFKTLEALARPGKSCISSAITKIRFSCPFPGCSRNRSHKKFRPLKSAICVKNHFKRSHCPKMYSCNRCNKKSFSVLADLKSHLKHCGQCRWKCSCGTSFSRKDKLFGHLALFEGHMPAVMEEEKSKELVLGEGFHMDEEDALDNSFIEGLLDGFDPIDGSSLDDVLGFSGLGSPTGFDKLIRIIPVALAFCYPVSRIYCPSLAGLIALGVPDWTHDCIIQHLTTLSVGSNGKMGTEPDDLLEHCTQLAASLRQYSVASSLWSSWLELAASSLDTPVSPPHWNPSNAGLIKLNLDGYSIVSPLGKESTSVELVSLFHGFWTFGASLSLGQTLHVEVTPEW
ncbi:hypothetical protein H6P81_011467 [Aristolochia fimbriata]|uniref:C2H2-type domain-containing protein n=1 Tax=Aristolochia fimbriata TaxID=158543 RepID=A0AAV7EV40_ARIFI|nr:hypothetical protein H6P81_011467 [Aristolochia fimbriata]